MAGAADEQPAHHLLVERRVEEAQQAAVQGHERLAAGDKAAQGLELRLVRGEEQRVGHQHVVTRERRVVEHGQVVADVDLHAVGQHLGHHVVLELVHPGRVLLAVLAGRPVAGEHQHPRQVGRRGGRGQAQHQQQQGQHGLDRGHRFADKGRMDEHPRMPMPRLDWTNAKPRRPARGRAA
ncbi:hypothetical protein [Luteimonas sp. J29]|uniref:hypothetical protein n=1 Tax=Luteimonas sp. J29 TaxID=935863 RepID=UPI00047A640A|nr:hypothetical protein [Luteimonas sp. J29]